MKASRSTLLATQLAPFGLGLDRTFGNGQTFASWMITTDRYGHTFAIEKRNLDEVSAFISSLKTSPHASPVDAQTVVDAASDLLGRADFQVNDLSSLDEGTVRAARQLGIAVARAGGDAHGWNQP